MDHPPGSEVRAGRPPTGNWILLTGIPLAQALAFGAFSRLFGRFWMGGTVDPTYAYLLNALLLAEGHAPYLSEHPGTTVEAIGAVVIRAIHALAPSAHSLRDDVLTQPERFAVAINAVLVAAIALANTFQGWAVCRLTRSWACTATAQLAPFLATTVLACGIHVMAEPLLVALGLVLAGGVACVLSDDSARGGTRWEVWLGVVMGLGVATKLLFAPLGLLPLAVLPRLRERLVYCGTAALTLAGCLIPVATRLPVTLAYYRMLATHTGSYGQGDTGLLSLGGSAHIVGELIAAEPFVHAAALLGALVGGVALARSRGDSSRRRAAGALLSVVLVQLVGDVMTAKHPPARPYYLTSGIALSGLCLALVLFLVRGPGAGPARRWPIRALVGLLLAVGGILQSQSALADFRERRRVRAAVSTWAATGIPGNDGVIQGHRVSSLASCLEFGNVFAGSSFSADLRRLYPRVVLFDSRGIHRFGEPIGFESLRGLADREGSLRLWDSLWLPLNRLDRPTQATVEVLKAEGDEKLLRVTPQPLAVADEPVPATPAVAGVLALGGPALWVPGEGKVFRYETEPPTRLAFSGRGGPQWLSAEARYQGAGMQGMTVSLNGVSLGRYDLPPERWVRLESPLAAVPGLNEIEIEYDRTRDGGPWPPLGALPSMGPGRSRRVLVGVRFRRLQILDAGGPTS